jgi:hypothetical protein
MFTWTTTRRLRSNRRGYHRQRSVCGRSVGMPHRNLRGRRARPAPRNACSRRERTEDCVEVEARPPSNWMQWAGPLRIDGSAARPIAPTVQMNINRQIQAEMDKRWGQRSLACSFGAIETRVSRFAGGQINWLIVVFSRDRECAVAIAAAPRLDARLFFARALSGPGSYAALSVAFETVASGR